MLTLIDGNSLLFRAYYGVRGNLSRSDGTPTGAVYGFYSMILPILAAAIPGDKVICVFDASRITFRNDIYPQYKANRGDTPADLVAQIELTRNAARSMGMNVLCINGVEADDVIATLAVQNCHTHNATRIITSDKDLMQLVSDCVFIYDGMKEKEIRKDGVFEKFGVRPDQVIDVQSLMGDASDNVPGVPGIGPKKAAELINQFGSLDNLYENLSDVKNDRIRNLLIDNAGAAKISRQLVSLKTDVDLGDITLSPFVFPRVGAIDFVRNFIESNSIIARIEKLFPNNDNTNARTAIAPIDMCTFLDATPIAKSQSVNMKFQTIQTVAELDNFLATITDILAIDTETTGLSHMTDKIVGISLSGNETFGVYIPIRHKSHSDNLFDTESVVPNQLSMDTVREKLMPYFTNPKIVKIAHNMKYDLHILANDGWDVNSISPIDDTMLLSYILNGTLHLHNLDDLAKLYLNHKNITFAELFTDARADKNFANLDINIATPYAAEDATVCIALYKIFREKLNGYDKLKSLYETCDLPMVKILLNMERCGVLVDTAKLKKLSVLFHQQLGDLQKQIWDYAGHEFNIASPKQLGVVLFDELNLAENKKRSTDNGTLNDLMDTHPIIELVQQWRSIAKLAGTYADALPRQIGVDGRIHTSYLQTSTNTGRLSSRDPNLQNIPIKTKLGTEIRQCFIAGPGRVLIAADYSQIQLRLLADVANIKTFRDTFNSDADIHEQTARKIFNIDNSAPVSNEQRRSAKTVNFSIIYGISSFGLSAQLGISRADAQVLINSYMDALPEIKIYMDKIREFATENACVYTPWGRRIELPEIRNSRLRAYALRAAVNAPIQGFESDLMKRAMINIDMKIADDKNIKMIMQVHDEIVFECDESMAEKYANMIKTEMENAADLSVPLRAEYTIDKTWGK